MSVGAHLVAKLAGEAARTLEGADVEIVELHHKRKKDAPSGTALMMARAVAKARGQAETFRTVRSGDAPRVEGEIGVLGVRGGDVVGEHTVYLFVEGERVELTHRVSDRSIFAKGALRAARWLAQAGPGLHTMADVLKG
jgi:4-hydroxy-tetrahydrodipicolinate reductase